MTTSQGARRKRGWRRALSAGMAVAAVSSGLLGGSAQAAPVYTFVPIGLTVHDLQDNDYFPWTDWRDEPHMRYGGTEWADVVYRGTYGGTINPANFTGGSMTFNLWERDRDWMDTDNLGTQTVTPSQLDQELTMTFRGNWFHYEFTYKVVQQ